MQLDLDLDLALDGAAQGVGTIPRRRRLNALLAIAAIAAIVVIAATMVALLVWVVPLGRSGVGAEDVIPKAGAAIVHDDAGNMNRYSYPLPPGKVAQPNAGVVGSALIHDDAGNLNSH